MGNAKPEPLILAIFGASGDLAHRKLLPAIFDLFKRDYLSDHFVVLGISRSQLSDDAFRDQVFFQNEFINLSAESDDLKTAFANRLFYQPIDTNSIDDYELVKQRLESLNAEFQTAGNIIFYLSTPPVLYEKIP